MAERTQVLVVDDEVDIREAMQALLQDVMGLEVLLAGSGRQGLDIVETAGEDLRIIISDYRMPEMDGLEFLAKAQEIRPEIARVLVTAYADTTLAVRAVNEARIARFLPKPIEPAQIETLVKEILDASRAARLREAAFKRSMEALKKRGEPKGDANE
jgi:two-component system NtrC family sensor kinase